MKDSIKREQRQAGLHFAERENQRSLAGGKSNSRATLKKKIFLILALLCAVAQGTWADDGWSSASSYDKDSDADKPTHYDTYGGRSDVHVIKTAANYLYVMDKPAYYCNKNIYLDINVDVSSKTWTNLDNNILGVHRYLESGGSGYRGTFYGNGHTIRINLDYESYSSYKGPFGIIAEGGKVQDLNVEGTIYLKKMDDGNGTDLVGGICGENNGTIENCSVSASVSSEENYLGGITGRNTGTGTISNCRVSGNVSSNSRLVGGIAGENNGTISNCWVSGNVSSDWKNSSVAATAKVGGIAGENNGTIEYCCMTGNVTNNDADVGGLVGDNDHSGATVRHCTFYGTRNSTHDQASIYVGDSGTEEYLFGIFSLDEYNAASGKDMYRHAIRYTYAVNVTTVGPGTIRTWAADEYDVTRTYPNATFSLNVTSGTMARYTLTDADGNNIDLQGHANDWSSFWFVMPKKNVTATVYFYADWPTQGAGTVDDPYIISSADDWNKFANNVSCGRPYSGSHVKLTADISVTTKAGGTFSGTFDGDGHTITANISGTGSMALFNRLNGGTIKNLTVAGGISGGQHTAALLVSLGNDGTNLVENCVITANVNCSESHMGGFLAHGNESNITFRGCVFKGKMTGGSTAKGVFYGWGSNSASGTRSITDCLYIMADGQDTDGLDLAIAESNGTFAVSNCYKTASAGSQGTQVYSISGGTGVSVANAGVAGSTYNVSGLTFCNIGLQCGDVAYAANGNTVSLTIGSKSGYTTSGYTASAGTLSGTGNPYTLTMPGSNVTISASECSANALTPDGSGNYLINSVDDWNTFCAQIEHDTNTFSGKTVKLTDDISVETMAGVWSDTQSERRVFSGTFDGDGHTLTINVSNQGRFAAPFKCVSGATIRNLHTAGTIDGTGNSDGKLLAGIVGVSFGNTTISGCRSSVTLTTNFGEDAALGGLVAGTKGGSLTIDGCVFDGSMTGASNTRCAGIAGFEYEATTTTITNTLFAPATLTVSTTDDTYTKTFTRDGDATITSCYYTKVLGAAQGTEATASATAPVNLGALLHDYGLVNAYQHGILFDGLYYVDPNAPTFQLLKAATSGDVGMVVCAYGHLHDAKTAVPTGCTAVGILGKVTETGIGLILALQDATPQTWNTINSWEPVTGYAGTTLKLLPDDAARGSLASYTKLGDTFVSNWAVAQKSDYEAIFINLGSTTGDKKGTTYDDNVNAYITTGVGGTALSGGYWSATNLENYYAWGFGSNYWYDYGKAHSDNVRPVLGFTFIASELSGTGTAGDPYTISNSDEWQSLASHVNNGNNFSGKYVKLTSDISVTTPVGYRVSDSDNKPFSGTFLGSGHTITVTLDDDGNQGLAPFCYINGATIKDLKVAGTIASSQYHTSGLVGFANGTNTIEDCLVTATLNITSNYAGGIIGHGLNSNTTIRGCAFTGTVNGVDVERENIGGIWGWSNSGTPTLLNCLENGTYTNIASMHPMGLQKAAGTITNCYYMNPQVGSPQNACTVSGAKQAYTAATAPANRGKLVQAYGMVKAYQNGILYDGKYYVAPASISLANAADNSTTINDADGYLANVTLTDRTLYKDGKWNTLCLPFSVTLAGSPLAGATARPLTSASISGTTLNLSFGTAVDELVSGTPYIIKWASGANLTETDLVFSGVTIDSDLHPYDNEAADDARVRFLGTYASQSFSDTDNTILLMGAANTLYYPTTGAGLGAQRAYFKLGEEGALLARRLTAFNIDFGDESTGIISLTPDPSPKGEGSDYWYTLDGRRLSGKPSRAGVYINNGIKVVIK